MINLCVYQHILDYQVSIKMPRCNNKTVPVALMSMKIQWKSFFLVSTVLLPPILKPDGKKYETYPAWIYLLRDHHNQGAFGCWSSIILPTFILWTLSLACRNWRGVCFCRIVRGDSKLINWFIDTPDWVSFLDYKFGLHWLHLANGSAITSLFEEAFHFLGTGKSSLQN